MSKNFTTNKDHIINELDERYNLSLSDDEYDRLRKLTESELLLFAMLLSRTSKNARVPSPSDG